jgi:hypothetical protein
MESTVKKVGRSLACLLGALILFFPFTLSCSPASGFSVSFSFSGPMPNPGTVYAVWIEDENGNNLQNLYVCDREASLTGLVKTLTGDALPNWLTKKYPQHKDIAGVTGASKQGGVTVNRDLQTGTAKKIRICFDIDRSRNDNAFFVDRPAFTYSTELIDLDNLKPSYPLSLAGWMSNSTDGASYGQQPKSTIPGFAQYKLMTDTSYIQDGSGSTADMVASAQAVIVKK